MSLTRTTLLAGPAAVTFADRTFFARDGITVAPALEFVPVLSDANGLLDETATPAPLRISFIPHAPFSDLLALYPWLAGAPGTSLFGPADEPLVITAASGTRLTFVVAAIVQMPDLHLAPQGAVAGEVAFVVLGGRTEPITAAQRLVAFDTAAIPLAAFGTPRLTDDFTATWGGAPWTALRGRDGIHVRFALETRPVRSDANGWLDLTLEKLSVAVSFTPRTPGGPAESDLVAALQLQGVSAAPSRPLSSTAKLLVVAGHAFTLRLPAAQLTTASWRDDALHPRLGKITFSSIRAFLDAPQPLALLAA